MGDLRVDGLEVAAPTQRYFARKRGTAQWHVLLAFGLFCCMVPFVLAA